MNDKLLFISIFRGNAFTSVIDEAFDTKEPFMELPPPISFESGFVGFMGLIHFSFPPKKEVTSMTTFPLLRASILKAFNTVSMK